MKKKGKGLSFDQKREKMLQIFHKTVYNYDIIDRKMYTIFNKLKNCQLRQGFHFQV